MGWEFEHSPCPAAEFCLRTVAVLQKCARKPLDRYVQEKIANLNFKLNTPFIFIVSPDGYRNTGEAMPTQSSGKTDEMAVELLYELDERPPDGHTFSLGLQFAVLSLGGVVLMPTIAFQYAGVADSVQSWAVFASLLIAGGVSVLQASPVFRFGAGYILVTGPTAAAIAITVDALSAGGPSLLLSLVIVTALIQFGLSFRISMFRRIITPTVSGIILMLIPVTVSPLVFQRISEVTSESAPSSGLACAAVTLLTIIVVSVKGGRHLRPWSPIIGVFCGAAVALVLGEYDVGLVTRAAWVGMPNAEWPAISLEIGPSFWSLLPAFLFVSLSCTIRTMSASLAIQDVSWRMPRAPDLRAVQGAIAAEALSNMLAGLTGTMLNTTRSTTVFLVRNTQVSCRRVGVVLGVALAALAFLPKLIALILALPASVLAAYLFIMISTLFVTGMKIVVAEGLDNRRIMTIGLSFWIGIGCHYGLLLPETLPRFAGGLLNNGLTAGSLTAIVMTALLELTKGRRRRLKAELDMSSLPELNGFVTRFGTDNGWSTEMLERVNAVVEEILLTLMQGQPDNRTSRRQLQVTVHNEDGDAILECVAKSGDSNIEDRISLLGDAIDIQSLERDTSLRLLRHLASEVRHRQYHDIDLITARIERPEPAARR